MILEPEWSVAFIGDYKNVLLDIAGLGAKNERMLDALIRGRDRLVRDHSILAVSLARLGARNAAVDEEVIAAISSLQVARWIYLRDTTKHSVFMDPAGTAAYGVVGLTHRIRELLGESGAVIETGLFTYKQRLVCDGLVSFPARLGTADRRRFNERLSAIRKAGAFSDCVLAPPQSRGDAGS